ncbi:MAG: hypothetical protein CFE21_08560 [Bacteroidetes bacterium B1(2017)]|nr:MAG: hypothetical protein CFE21_08560 [Bacteroidetes bacterium B1(2017)]
MYFILLNSFCFQTYLNTMRNTFLCFGLAIVLFASCKKEPTEQPPLPPVNTGTVQTPDGMIKLSEGYLMGANAKVFVYAYQNLFVGFNTLYVAAYDSTTGKRLNEGNLFCTGVNSTLGQNPKPCAKEELTSKVDSSQLFKVSFILDKPSSDSTNWTFAISYSNSATGRNGTAVFSSTVSKTTDLRVLHLTQSTDSNEYVVAYIPPSKLKVGLNDAEFVIHKYNKDTKTYSEELNLTTVISLFMPSMGHGSPNNVNPLHTANGHYLGKSNFTMSGVWEIRLSLYKNTNLLSDQLVFNYTIAN